MVAVGLLTLLVVLPSAGAPNSAKWQGEEHTTIAFGIVLCWAGVIVIWASVIRVWRSARAVKDSRSLLRCCLCDLLGAESLIRRSA